MKVSNTTLAGVVVATVLAPSIGRADVIIFATERENQKIVSVNLTTNTVTTVFNTPDVVDSLVIDTQGRYIYDEPLAGQVRRFDPAGPADILLADTNISQPQDLILSPTGSTLYTANFAAGTITQTNMAGPFPNATICKHIPGPEGLAFDNLGHLFLLAGFNTASSGIYQIDPVTCATINSNVGFDPVNQLDGLTFDPSTGRLFATSSGQGGSNAVYSIDPTTLAAVKIATVPSPDGLINNASGTLYIASRAGFIYSVNESTFAVTQLTPVPTIDDLGIASVRPPTGGKTITPSNVAPGGTSTVTITITNPNSSLALSGVGFTDTLPSGVTVAATPGVVNGCGGIIAGATSGSTSVSLSGATLAPAASCTVNFNITDSNPLSTVSTNCVGATSTSGGNDAGPFTVASGRCATITVTNITSPPTGAKSISPSTVLSGGTATVTITITNPNSTTALASVGFTDTLPAGVTVASSPSLSNGCGGSVTGATSGSGAVSLSGASLAGGASCAVKFDVTDGNGVGSTSTNCVTASSSVGTDPGPITVAAGRCATINVASAAQPGVTKQFGTANLLVGATTTMTITISNPGGNPTATNVNFSDNFAATAPGLTIATPNALVNTCGGVATASGTTVTLTGGALAAGPSSCAVTVNVVGTAPGPQVNNVSVNLTLGGVGFTVPASGSTTVSAPPPMPPDIAKTFGAATVPVFSSTSLTFLITNPNTTTTLTGVNFVDTLPVGLVVSTPPNLIGSCGGGTITAVAGTNSVGLSGATLPPLGSCSFSVNVTAILAGPQLNTTSNIQATGGFVGNSASAPLNVNPPPDSYQIDYLPNVQVDGVVDLSNAGALGADPFGPRSGTTGRICANVYAFSPDEQEISCCSCLLTPNSLAHLTAADLISNTSNGTKPDSIVVKVLFTVPGATPTSPGTQAGPFTSSTCNAAFPFALSNLAPGGVAWATKLHAFNTSPITYGSTETQFKFNPIDLGTLSRNTVGEIAKLTTLCQFIVGNQSGAGLCRSCTIGGLGGVKK